MTRPDQGLSLSLQVVQHHKNVPSMCCSFRIYYYFSSTRLVELLLWLDKPLLNPKTWFGKRHGYGVVLFDVSIAILYGQFHGGNRGHGQNTDFLWVRSHFPMGKRSSGVTATNVINFNVTW